MGLVSGIAGIAGKSYDYVTPGKGSNRLSDWSGWGDKTTSPAPKAPAPNYGSGKSGSTTTSAMPGVPDLSSIYNQAYYNALAASRTPVPRMVNFDVGSSWNKAREMATQAVSPIYQQKMTDFVNRQQQELARQQADTTTQKSAFDLALQRLMGDTSTERTRTAQDTTTNIADIKDTQAFTTRNDSLNFDAASRALTEGVGAGNMAQSGLGQQQIQENQQKYRDTSNEQIRQMDNKVEAQNTLMTRSFEDLVTKEQRSTEDTVTAKSKLDLDMERYIEDQTYARDQEQKQQSLDQEAEIAQKSIGLQGQLADQWIQSLSGKGYTAQEIANAASIYR